MKLKSLSRQGVGLPLLAGLLVTFCVSAACVTENRTTGEVVPRGNQKYSFDRVEEAAEGLKIGMSKPQVLLLLGSPAETDENGNVWIYLPERYAVLIPARALRLEFREQMLAEHGFQAIVLGARL